MLDAHTFLGLFHGASLSQSFHQLPAVAQFLQDLLGMLPQEGGKVSELGRGLGELHGEPELLHLSLGWMLQFHDHVEMEYLGFFHYLIKIQDRADAGIGLLHNLKPFVPSLCQDLIPDGGDRLIVFLPGGMMMRDKPAANIFMGLLLMFLLLGTLITWYLSHVEAALSRFVAG